MSVKAILTEQQKSYTKAEEDALLSDYYNKDYIDTYMAPLDTPTFIGTPKAPTAAAGTNTTQIATTAFVEQAKSTRVPMYGMGKNLLRNWYFGNPVNQRGQSSYSGQKYTIDGWKTVSDNSAVITINGGYITFAPSQSQSYFVQCLMDYGIPLGRTVTISALIGGDLWTTSFAIPSTRPGANVVVGRHMEDNGYIALVTDANADYQFQVRSAEITRTLYAVKLELGSEQTLCHNEGTSENPVWVLNEIPDYEYELYRCMTSTADSSDTYANKTLATGQELAYVETGTTASRNYTTGQYICWNGLTYTADTNIALGATLSASGGNKNLTECVGGGLNSLSLKHAGTAAGTQSVALPATWTEVICVIYGHRDFTVSAINVGRTLNVRFEADVATGWVTVSSTSCNLGSYLSNGQDYSSQCTLAVYYR